MEKDFKKKIDLYKKSVTKHTIFHKKSPSLPLKQEISHEEFLV